MPDATARVGFACADLTTFCRLDELADVPAHFDRPGPSNCPTEAINGRLEHLRGPRPRLPQPHQLHRPKPPGGRRIQTPTTPSIMMSPLTLDPTHRYQPQTTRQGEP